VRFALYVLPLVTVAVVCFALFVVGRPRAYAGARIYGGPTDDLRRISLRVEAVERLAELEGPIASRPLSVELQLSTGRALSWSGGVDGLGIAHVTLPLESPASGPLRVNVTFADQPALPLATGELELSHREWSKAAKQRGGWLDGRRSGRLVVDVAAGRGAMAVPFAAPVLIRVRDSRGPLAHAELSLAGEGLSIERPPPGASLRSDALGRAEALVRPLEHVVALRVSARLPNGEDGDWYATLPIVPGALHARLARGELWIESPIAREVAYFALTDRQTRLYGGSVRLQPDGHGGAAGSVKIPALGTAPLWAVVSSEAALDSPSAVGWPLEDVRATQEPRKTWTVPDRMLFDGLVQGHARDTERKARARLLAGGFSAGAAVLMALLLLASVRMADADIATRLRELEQLPEFGVKVLLPRGWALLVAAVCIALGCAVVALVAMQRIQ
jgi:hypothetical protein